MPSYEYRRATWDEVQALGPQGWRLVPLPPVQEVKQVLGQMQASEPLYVMERNFAPSGEGARQVVSSSLIPALNIDGGAR